MSYELDGWFEYTTIGAMYTSSVVLLTLSYLGISDIRVLGQVLRDYAAYLVPLLLASSYLVGRATSRLLTVVGDVLPESVRRLIRGPRNRLTDDGHSRQARRLQHGSVDLVRYGTHLHRTLELFRSLLVATPLLAASFIAWAAKSEAAMLIIPVAVSSLFMVVVLFGAHYLQHRAYYRFVEAARLEIDAAFPPRK